MNKVIHVIECLKGKNIQLIDEELLNWNSYDNGGLWDKFFVIWVVYHKIEWHDLYWNPCQKVVMPVEFISYTLEYAVYVE